MRECQECDFVNHRRRGDRFARAWRRAPAAQILLQRPAPRPARCTQVRLLVEAATETTLAE